MGVFSGPKVPGLSAEEKARRAELERRTAEEEARTKRQDARRRQAGQGLASFVRTGATGRGGLIDTGSAGLREVLGV